VVIGYLFVPSGEMWQHLADTVLADYVTTPCCSWRGTLGPCLGGRYGLGHQYVPLPGRGIFEWALLLPMAMPAYIIAYTYTGLWTSQAPYRPPCARSPAGLRGLLVPRGPVADGAAVMLSLVLYPYVYLLSRAAFLGQSCASWT